MPQSPHVCFPTPPSSSTMGLLSVQADNPSHQLLVERVNLEIRERKEKECRCDRSPKVSLGQKMQLLLLERVFFFVLICCSCWLPCLGEADGSSYYYQQDFQAPAYYQEGNYYPDYQEEYYRGGGGYYNQESWRRQDQAEEQDEESPIPVIIKGFF